MATDTQTPLDFYGAWEGMASPTPPAAAEAGYGAGGAGVSGISGLLSALNPFHAFGISMIVGLTATAFLVALYFALPARRG